MPLTLIPSTAAHAPFWLRWREQPRGLRFNPYAPATLEELSRRMETEGAGIGDLCAPAWRWMIRRDEDGAVIGTVSVLPNARMGTGEIGYQLDEHYHGRGLGTRATALLVERCFSLEIRRLHATVAVENLASRRLLERLGFVQEGLLREHYLIQGVPTDECVYGLLAKEFTGDIMNSPCERP